MQPMSENELLLLIQTSLGLKDNAINLFSSMENIEDWDSLGHLNILVGLDSRLDGRPAEIMELATAKTVEEIAGILRKHELLK